MSAINLDEPRDWPSVIRDLLEEKMEKLHEEAVRSRELADQSGLLVRRPPSTPVRDCVKRRLEEIVANKHILTYHATRLDDAGLCSINECGLRGFTQASLMENLNRLLEGLPELQSASKGFKDIVSNRISTELEQRYNVVHLLPTLDDLQTGAHDFFARGGECIQEVIQEFGNKVEILEAISRRTKPFLVTIDLPISMVIGLANDLPESLIRRWLHLHDFDTGGRDVPSISLINVPANYIVSINSPNQSQFLQTMQ